MGIMGVCVGAEVCVIMSDRKYKIDQLFSYVKGRIEASEKGYLSRRSLLSVYAYESGFSLRTLREYLDILNHLNKVHLGSPHWDPKVTLGAEAS